MVRITELLASGFLIFGAIYAKKVPEELGIAASVGAAVALCVGIAPASWRNNLFRALVFVTGVAAVYSLLSEPRFDLLQNWQINAYMVILGMCLIFTVRLTRREVFKTTPLDVLIIAFVLAIVAITSVAGQSVGATQFADTAIRLAVFFYVGEYLSSRQKDGFRVLPMAATGALMIFAARGLMAG